MNVLLSKLIFFLTEDASLFLAGFAVHLSAARLHSSLSTI